MARNGAGTYNLPAGQPVVTGTVISSTTFNTLTSDIATALTASIANDGQTVPVANIPMGGFKLTGLGAATVNGDAVRYQEAVLAGADAKITSMTALTAPTVAANPMRATDIQAQLVTAFTTAGTSTAFTLTPTPAITANTTNQRFRVKFNAAAGATPTLAVSGQTAKNLKYYDSTGTKQSITSTQVPINWIADVEFDGTDWVVLNVPPAAVVSSAQIQHISASVGSNALTISASALSLDFRSTTLGSGTVTTVSGTPANLVISSGSTLGQTSAIAARLIVFALNNAGTIELAVGNASGCSIYDETGLISTTAEGGAGAADSATVVYSTTARTNVPYRVIGYLDNTQATAGTWATTPSTIQGFGGKALAGALTKTYISPVQTITSAGALTLAHGLGVVPTQFDVWLKCTTGENGYTAGDIAVVTGAFVAFTTPLNRGVSMVPDATNLTIRFGNDASAFSVMNKTSGVQAGCTNGNWQAIFVARV